MDDVFMMEKGIELNKEIDELNHQLNSLLLDPEKISDPHITQAFILLTTLMHKYGIQRCLENEMIFSKLHELTDSYGIKCQEHDGETE